MKSLRRPTRARLPGEETLSSCIREPRPAPAVGEKALERPGLPLQAIAFCSASRIAVPAVAMRPSILNSCSTTTGARPSVGSSQSTSAGLATSAGDCEHALLAAGQATRQLATALRHRRGSPPARRRR